MSGKKIEIEIFEGMSDKYIEFLDSIKPEDLNDDMRMLIEKYGKDLILDMCVNYGGTPLYFPVPQQYCKRALYQTAKARITNGEPVKKIAHDLSTGQELIIRVLNDKENMRGS
jgi:hypothetical protein